MEIEVVKRAATKRVGIVSRISNRRGNFLEVDVEPVWVRDARVSAARALHSPYAQCQTQRESVRGQGNARGANVDAIELEVGRADVLKVSAASI